MRNFCCQLCFGICDILAKTKRKKSHSASDNDLIIDDAKIYFLDIENLLNEYPNIDTLVYTSQKVKNFIYQRTKAEHRNLNGKINIKLNDKLYTVIILPSPSQRNTIPYDEKITYFKKALVE